MVVLDLYSNFFKKIIILRNRWLYSALENALWNLKSMIEAELCIVENKFWTLNSTELPTTSTSTSVREVGGVALERNCLVALIRWWFVIRLRFKLLVKIIYTHNQKVKLKYVLLLIVKRMCISTLLKSFHLFAHLIHVNIFNKKIKKNKDVI